MVNRKNVLFIDGLQVQHERNYIGLSFNSIFFKDVSAYFSQVYSE